MSDHPVVVREPDVFAGWRLRLYPTAGEAGGSFIYRSPIPRVLTPGAPAANPERSRQEAARRARGRLRRYCAANELNKFGTLTYRGAGCHDPVQLRTDVGAFFRSLRELLGGTAFPYVWVPEWHKTGHGLHVHFAVGQFIHRSLVEQAWGHGFIKIKLIGAVGIGSGRREEARHAARYLSKYVGKDFDNASSARLHRFDVAQGFQPPSVRVHGATAEDALEEASEFMSGALPSRVWLSADQPGWEGPPAVWASW